MGLIYQEILAFLSRVQGSGWMKKWSENGVLNRVMAGLVKIGIQTQKIDLSQIAVDGSFSPSTGWRKGSGSMV